MGFGAVSGTRQFSQIRRKGGDAGAGAVACFLLAEYPRIELHAGRDIRPGVCLSPTRGRAPDVVQVSADARRFIALAPHKTLARLNSVAAMISRTYL